MKHLYLLFWLCISCVAATAQVAQQDFDALKALYKATNGGNWKNKTGWDTTQNNVSSAWHGITVASGRVTSINLSYSVVLASPDGNNLVGTIPPEIGNLTALMNLYLGNNKLSGSIPSEIGNLTQLTSLSLYNNQLTGNIPASLCNLTNLNYLYLYKNQLTGMLSSCLGNLTELREIQLGDNLLSGDVPATFSQLNNLIALFLYNNNFTSLPDISSAPLQSVYVQDNNLPMGDLEPYSNVTNFFYAPQDSFDISPTEVLACDGGFFKLHTGQGGAQTIYTWRRDGNIVRVIQGNEELHSTNLTADSAGVYTCSVTNSLLPGLQMFSRKATVTMRTEPLIINLGADIDLCEGESATLDAGSEFDTFLWSPNGATTQTITVSTQDIYGVQASVNGCEASDDIVVRVSPAPVFDLGNDTLICLDEDITLDAGAQGDAFLWSDNSTDRFFTTNKAGTYSVAAVSINGCTWVDSIKIGSLPLPVYSLGSDISVCPHQVPVLQAPVGMNGYEWQGVQTNKNTYNAPFDQKYVCKVTDNNGCKWADTLEVFHLPVPDFDIVGKKQACVGDTVVLHVTPGFVAYQWAISGQNDSLLSVTTTAFYKVKVTGSNTCYKEDSLRVVFLDNPVSSLGDVSICMGQSVTLDAGAGFDTYRWNMTDSIQQTLTTSQAGKYKVRFTKNGCTGYDSSVVTVNPLPNIKLNNEAVCQGFSKTITVPLGFKFYLWSTGDTQNKITRTTAGDYWVKVTDNNNCVNADTMHLFVNQPPPVKLGADAKLCKGDTLWLDAGPKLETYQWYIADVNFFLSDKQRYPVMLQGKYRVLVADSIGCIGGDTIQVNTFNRPIVSLGNDAVICKGNNVVLDAQNAGKQFLWHNGATTQTLKADTSGKFWVRVTDAASGCFASDTVLLKVVPIPKLDLDDDLVLCKGTKSTITTDGKADMYLWNNVTGDSSYNVTVSGILKVEARNFTQSGGYCSTIDTVNVTLREPFVDIAGETQFCQGDFTILQASSGFSRYVWNGGDTLGVRNISINKQGWARVTAIDVYKCEAYDSVFVTVFPLPRPNLGNDTILCQGKPITLRAGTFASYRWHNNATADSLNITTTTKAWVRVTDNNNCVNTDTIQINVVPLPDVNLGNDTAVCETSQLILDAGNFAAIQWSDSSTQQTLQVTKAGTYSVVVTDTNYCQQSDTIKVVFVVLPQTFIGNDTALCEGESMVLNAGNNFDSYLWNTGNTTQTVEVQHTDIYWVRVGNVCGFYTDSMAVVVNPLPVLPTFADSTICNDESMQLLAGSGFDQYRWNSGQTDSTITVNKAGFYEVTVTLIGCKASSGANISTKSCLPNLIPPPTAFTPNGDGTNDTFMPEVENVKQYSLSIYNRWGRNVFRTQSVGSWDGTDSNIPCDTGMYYWALEYAGKDGNQHTAKGQIMLLRD